MGGVCCKLTQLEEENGQDLKDRSDVPQNEKWRLESVKSDTSS
jgi:hypothetical protein